MSVNPIYPFANHPCFSSTRENLWARIHLPVAPICNVKCAFCTHGIGSSCHTSKPGYALRVMSVEDAIRIIRREMAKSANLRIAAVSGPGEPLVNEETLILLQKIREMEMDLKLCLSTNGTLLKARAQTLANLDVTTVSVSISAIHAETAARIYEWARLDDVRTRGEAMGEAIIRRQISGITAAAEAGIVVKVNTILIPGINDTEITEIARAISKAGADLQNIVPLVPAGNMMERSPPSQTEIADARSIAAKYIPQFAHCMQCRSDVVGIPGNDRVL